MFYIFFFCRNLRAGFNSPGGYASVNHQHYHLYYLKERLFLENMVLMMMNFIKVHKNDYTAQIPTLLVSTIESGAPFWNLLRRD